MQNLVIVLDFMAKQSASIITMNISIVIDKMPQ